MTKRNPVSSIQNIWFDSEQVDAEDLSLEQQYNNNIHSSIINNHVGTGILSSDLVKNVLFDSNEYIGLLDGRNIQTSNQPSDNNYGNQLEIELSESNTAGRRSVKVAIIGLDFDNSIQYETFVFKANESQFSKRHYIKVLQVLINDLRGEDGISFNLGGRLVIREATPFTISRDTLSVYQNFQPNIFFRDFFVSPEVSTTNDIRDLFNLGLANYNIEELYTSIKQSGIAKTITLGDATTQIGQKFQAKTGNVQKITLLLSSSNSQSIGEDDYMWNGELVVSIYPLQTALQCPTDVPPETLLDYSPSNVPLAQITCNYDSLKNSGIVLNTVPQPVDFIFSNTSVGTASNLTPGNFYAFTIKRSGSNKGDISIYAGTKYLSDSRLTFFNGDIWDDSNTQDLWFEVRSHAAKITDGQAYLSGVGVTLPKVIKDSTTGSTVDYSLDNLSIYGNGLFTGVVFSEVEKSEKVQDLRTGNMVYSRQKNIPSVKLLSPLEIGTLSQTTDTLLVGNVQDKNINYFDPSLESSEFSINLHTFSFFNNEIFVKIIDDPSAKNYDLNNKNVNLLARLLNGDLTKIKLYPNLSASPSLFYRVSNAEIITAKYGDLNGDGIADDYDLKELKTFVGFDFNKTPSLNSDITVDTLQNKVTFVNGYRYYTNGFDEENLSSFYIVDSSNGDIIYTSFNGIIRPDLSNPSRATIELTDPIPDNSVDNNFVINAGSVNNVGGCRIAGIQTVSPTLQYLVIEKIILNKDTIIKLFAADLNDDYLIDLEDFGSLQSYVDKSAFTSTSSVSLTVGKSFKLVRLVLERSDVEDSVILLDRSDDYFTTLNDRNSTIHLLPDLIDNVGYPAVSDVSTNPISLFFEKQLAWEDYLVVSNSRNKLISSVFDNADDTAIFSGKIDGITVQSFNSKPLFNPGRVDNFIPDNLIIGDGDILTENGDFYKVDFEIGTVVLEIPPMTPDVEHEINIFSNFISDYQNEGVTYIGFPAMKFADGSFVQPDALVKDQIRMSVSLQAYARDGGILTDTAGVSLNYETGILKLNFPNILPINEEQVMETLYSKVQVTVFLKKAGFQNKTLKVNSEKMSHIIDIIASGKHFEMLGSIPGPIGPQGEVGPTGPTGPTFTGTSSQLVAGNGANVTIGTGLSLASGTLSSTVVSGSSVPLFVTLFSGSVSTNSISTSPLVIGGTYIDPSLLTSYTSMKLEALLSSSSESDTATLELYIPGTSTLVTSVSVSSSATAFSSSSALIIPTSSTIYEARLYISNSSVNAASTMARLRFY